MFSAFKSVTKNQKRKTAVSGDKQSCFLQGQKASRSPLSIVTPSSLQEVFLLLLWYIKSIFPTKEYIMVWPVSLLEKVKSLREKMSPTYS